MTESEQRPEYINLKKLIIEFLGQDWLADATKPSYGALGFSDVVPVLNRLRDLLILLDRADLSFFPPQLITQVQQWLTNLSVSILSMRNFDIRQNNASQVRDQIVDQLKNHYTNIFNVLAAPLAVNFAKDIDLAVLRANISEDVKKNVASVFAESENSAAQIREASKQASEVLAAMKEAAGQVGVSANAKVFADQATEHKASADRWMLFTVTAAILTVGWGTFVLWGIPISPVAPVAEIVQQAIAKLIVFSGLSYGLLWCARNYSANRHNYVLNKHRQNSLATFETFAKSAEGDPDTKNAILLQATTSIFAAQTTGYLTKEPEIDQPSKIVEIMRSVKGG
ncbi:hypothetical protein FHS83_001306 [Rhizomicrobium palustre]|uniref:Uncharacterized protein n=1 Tax=Rhizomicrobium palustre TaxID=189966 RepID=A0A846MWR0_9PROT|nr:hypothetical protein [Rhizomicrobium palustre]NIK87988.1 hypothetical protein [Rhizomicrobium palustre]